MNPSPTRLDSLELENFRCFSRLEVNFHEKITVIVAPNGGGKTAILDAAAIALWPFPCKMQLKDASPGFEPSDIRLVKSPLNTMQPVPPVRLKAVGHFGEGGQRIVWQRTRKSSAQGTRTSRAGSSDLQKIASDLWYENIQLTENRSENIPTYPLIAYYGTGRLWDQSKLTWGKLYYNKADTSRESGYIDSLSPKSSYKLFVDWFGRYSNEAGSEKASGKESPHKAGEKLKALTQAVNLVLRPTGWSDLKWDSVEKRPVATHPEHGVLPVDFLSDGLRNMIGLVSDIAHRCARLNPQFGADAAKRTPGIALVDEVDMHLHPEWQQLVLQALAEAFPMLQFIVTTHSPQVLTTVKRESIRILIHNPDGTGEAVLPDEETKGVESATVLAGVQGVDPIPPVEEATEFSRYRQLIQLREQDSTEGRELRAKLEMHFGPTHPLMLECERLIRFEAFKSNLKPKHAE